MRVALVSPYSYAYPGGVARHVEALADQLLVRGHEVRLLAPHDPDDRLTRALHGGVRPTRSEGAPDHVVPLGRTIAVPANGARSNLALSVGSVARLSRELRRGRPDVVHVHEPNAPLVSWCATELARVPLVGTFHAHSTSRPINTATANLLGARRLYNRLAVRIAVSEAARWTAERFYGGRYRIVPNGVDLDAATAAEPSGSPGPLRVLYLGRTEERKGLPTLMRAFESLRAEGVEVRLTVAGASPEEVRPLALDGDHLEVRGPVSEADKWRLLADADVLCAPSLGGESFGMVLVEALASSTPVVCSRIAGYRELVRDGVEGVLVPPGREDRLAGALAELAGDRERLGAMQRAARARAERFAWPRVADEVLGAYADALAAPVPQGWAPRAAARLGVRPADGLPPRPPRRLASLATPATRPSERSGARRPAALAGLAVAALLAGLAVAAVGADRVVAGVLGAAPIAVLAALVPMVGSLALRAEAWNAILRAALRTAPEASRAAGEALLPPAGVRRADTARATAIGVLMSATLPARLGELSRCLVMARRLGRVRERLPLVAGTVASQTLLNLVALGLLGGVLVATVALFAGGVAALVLATLVPAAALLALVAAPEQLALTRHAGIARSGPLRRAAASTSRLLARARTGFAVFGDVRLGSWAALAQLSAWALQWLACYVLLVALGLDHLAGLGAAAAVLFAVNAAGALPVLPANLGVFQAACVAVLSGYGVDPAEALAYGIVLQALELTTAVGLGAPALLGEGLSWRQMRRRALGAAALDLTRRPEARAAADG